MARNLIIIDIQNDYFPGGIVPLWQAEEAERRIVHAIKAARSHDDRVILVRHISTKQTGLFAKNSIGSELRSAVTLEAGDAPVVIKHFADAFQETDLTKHIQDGDELLLCGMMTQNCVAFTALSRFADAYKVSVISDLCAAPSEFVHAIALNALSSKTQVITSDVVW